MFFNYEEMKSYHYEQEANDLKAQYKERRASCFIIHLLSNDRPEWPSSQLGAPYHNYA